MEHVLGIGGVFFKARDPKALAAWYREHLGIPVEPEHTYAAFTSAAPGEQAVWSAFPADTSYFGSGPAPFMVNYRVRDLDAMLAQLRVAGAQVDDRGLRLWPVRLGDRPRGQPIRAMGAAFTRTRVSAPRRTIG